MAITPDFKRFDLFRTGRRHFLSSDGENISTQEWQDTALTAPFTDTPQQRVSNPISHIQAVANQQDQSASDEAFYDSRITVTVGSKDPAIYGYGWDPDGTSGAYTLVMHLDEGQTVVGPFEYVSYDSHGGTAGAAAGLMCYEIIQ